MTVRDTTPPTINCGNTNKTVEYGAVWSFDLPTASDIGGTNTITVVSTVTNTAGHCGNTFDATRTWRATDACGNFAQCSQTVTILDTTAPSVTILSPTNGSVFIAPATITLVADVFDTGRSVDVVEFFIGTNKVGEATSGSPYILVLTNVSAGTNVFRAATSDGCANAAVSAAVTVTILDRPPLTVIEAMHFNPQTGLFEQMVRVFNPTGSEYEAVRVYVENLTDNTTVWNQSGITNGVPYVQSNARILPGNYVDMLIEYYVPSRIAPNPILRAELVPLADGAGASVFGNAQRIERGVMLPNRTFLLEFSSVSNHLYYVQYSSDLTTWKTAQPEITGNGTRVQWIDNGQPKTESAPVTEQMRFYHLIVLP